MIGKTISHYKILEKLGEGGWSTVYKAEDVLLERVVALKVLSERLQQNSKARLRFLRGAQAVARLDHPNICHVYEVDETEGRPFFAMAFVEGQSLSRKLEIGPLEIREAVEIGLQTAEGLRAAHEKNIIHRDMKDGNIMINIKGQVKILDFGLAKLLEKENITKPRAILGTIPYMSPEQATGKPVDRRTDIWSLGVVMYRMLTGNYPFKGRNASETIRAIVNDQPKPIRDLRNAVPEAVESYTLKMMRKARGLRFQNMREVIAALKQVEAD